MGVSYNPKVVTDNLVIHLDASNPKSYPGSGNTWYDMSGRGSHFTWNAAPSYTSSYISTLGRYATGPNADTFGITSSSGYTIFVLSQQLSLTYNFVFCFPKSGTDLSTTRGITSHIIDPNGNIYMDQGGCCGTDTRINTTANASSWTVWTFRRVTGSSTRHIMRNGTTIVTNTNAAADPALSANSTFINKHIGVTTFDASWDARLNSFMVYNRGLSDNEVKQNVIALRGRFGI